MTAAAGEALVKAGYPPDAPLVLGSDRNRWLSLRSGDVPVATTIVRVEGESRPVAIALVCRARTRL